MDVSSTLNHAYQSRMEYPYVASRLVNDCRRAGPTTPPYGFLYAIHYQNAKETVMAKKPTGGGRKSPPPKPPAKKQSSSDLSSLASKVLSGAKKPTAADAKKLAASVLSQDEKKGR